MVHKFPERYGFCGSRAAFGQFQVLLRVIIHLQDMMLIHHLDRIKMIDMLLLGRIQIPGQCFERIPYERIVGGQQLFIFRVERDPFLRGNQKTIQFPERFFPALVHGRIDHDFADTHFHERFLQCDERTLELLAFQFSGTQFAVDHTHFISVHMNGCQIIACF